LVPGSHALAERLSMTAFDKVQCGPAETAACQPGANASRIGFCLLNQQIEFRATVFKVLLRAFVTFEQEPAKQLEVIRPKRLIAALDPVIFAHHVHRAAVLQVGKFTAARFKIRRRHKSQ
jgi:hypothetical protein